MQQVQCYECGRRYDYDEDGFCPRCGAFNQPPRESRISADGTIIRTPVGAIPVTGLNTQGVRLMRVDGSRIVCVAPSDAEDEDEGEALPDEANTGAVSDALSGEGSETNGEPDSLDRLVDDLEANPEPPAGDDDI